MTNAVIDTDISNIEGLNVLTESGELTDTEEKSVKMTRGELRRNFLHFIHVAQNIVLGRDLEIVMIMAAILSRNHVLLFGPAGEGKSLLAHTILSNIEDVEYMKAVLFADMESDSLIGAVITEEFLKGNPIVRTTKRLPEAQYVFLDELGKATGNLKTVLFPLMNEREFRNGDEIMKVPLNTLIAATNEVGDEMEGLYSRFLLKLNIKRPSTEVRMELGMRTANEQIYVFNEDRRINDQMITLAQSSVKHIKLSPATYSQFLMFAEGIESHFPVDTRKLNAFIGFMKAMVWLSGRASREIEVSDLRYVPNLFADEPNDIDFLTERVKSFQFINT